MKTHRMIIGVLIIAVSIAGSSRIEALQSDSTGTKDIRSSQAASVSPALSQVVKMIESGVAEEVVLAYVRNSPVPKPNADEVIYLHDAGVSSPVIMALLSHNGTSTPADNGRVLAKLVSEQPVRPQPVASPSVVYAERPPVYVQPNPVVVYTPSYVPSYYSYPYYGGYYGPSLSLGFSFGHHGFGHHFFGHHGGHFGHGFGGHHSGHGGLHWARH